MTTPYIAVQGTHGWDDDPETGSRWWEPTSQLTRYLETLGLEQVNVKLPFMWSTELDGLLGQKKTTWKGAAYALRYYLGDQFPTGLPYESRNFIAHSHGGQVVFYAAAQGLKIRNLITVGTPVRGDLEAIVARARPNIRYWLHVCDSYHDFTSLAGALFDGRLRIEHQFATADRNDNCAIFNINHSKVLTDPTRFPLWHQREWALALQRE